MTSTKIEPTVLNMRRVIKAPVERVFKAWTEPEQMSKWFGCGTVTRVLVTQDFRVGGEYRISCQCEEGELIAMYGTFKLIDPNRKVVYTWNNTSTEFPAKDTIVTVEFNDNGDTTEILLAHERFTVPVSVEGHSMGWGTALDKFAALFGESLTA
jgi:uncharacterized protein YndB with AHSA1/START domain